ncbi:hypothetical protein M011DRAFT_470491, partial [Sporormia fimetaria CBS 119925]
ITCRNAEEEITLQGCSEFQSCSARAGFCDAKARNCDAYDTKAGSCNAKKTLQGPCHS